MSFQTENVEVSSQKVNAEASFQNMNLDASLLLALEAQKFEKPTEIQTAAIPLILQKHDLMATADTGSGKTLAFIVPALARLMEKPLTTEGRGPRVVILSPTRELAAQIHDTARKLLQRLPFKFGTITGGVGYPPQERLLREHLDCLIATPGRLIDHMNRGRVDFSRVELFVLDEADRMLDMGFHKDVVLILNSFRVKPQILLFSATLEGDIQKIAEKFLKNPIRIELAQKRKPHTHITQRVHQANDVRHKQALLEHILQDSNVWQAIVFTKTKRGAERLADNLDYQRIPCEALHGDIKQNKRTQIMQRMHRGDIRVLIATDVAARGLDVKRLSHVINFDLPSCAEDYVHRIGRTGRAGETGIAISLVGPDEWSMISHIERHTGQRLERAVISGLEPSGTEPKMHQRSSSNASNGGGRGRRFGGGNSRGGQPSRSQSSPRKSFSDRPHASAQQQSSRKQFSDRPQASAQQQSSPRSSNRTGYASASAGSSNRTGYAGAGGKRFSHKPDHQKAGGRSNGSDSNGFSSNRQKPGRSQGSASNGSAGRRDFNPTQARSRGRSDSRVTENIQ